MQENMRKGLELAQEMAETAAMSAEDARSAIPVRNLLPSARVARGLSHKVCRCILVPSGIIAWSDLLFYLKSLSYHALVHVRLAFHR